MGARVTSTEQNPNVLAFYLSPRSAYRDELFSKNEIFCSPDCERSDDPAESQTVKTPVGRYDVQVVLRQLPRSAWPEVLVVKADGTLRNLPGNLDSIDCVKVLVLGDTHHLRSPIASLLNYAMTERFDFLVSDTNRQHVHFFRSAGFRRSYWLPNLTWSPHWRDVRNHSKHDVVFVGQTGLFHPWRRALLGEVARRGLPVLVESLPQGNAADRYADSKVVLNCSLNGDLNLRTFEVLAAGGLLLTDKLSTYSGFHTLFHEGRDLVTYTSVEDLVEKAHYYMDHLDQALGIRVRGREAIERAHDPALQRARFLDLALNDRMDPRLEVDDARTVSVPAPIAQILPRVAAYEWVQEIHRNASKVRIFNGGDSALVEDSKDLPRLTAHSTDFLSEYLREPAAFVAPRQLPRIQHLLILRPNLRPKDLAALLGSFRGEHLIVEDAFGKATYSQMSDLVAELCAWGFSPVHTVSFAFKRVDATASLKSLQAAGSAGAVIVAATAIQADSNDAEACHAAGLAAAGVHDRSLSMRCFETAARLDRGHSGALQALANLRVDSPSVKAREANRVVAAASRRRYLVVTNLFPPEELGGYGRKMHAFATELSARGHDVRVVTGAAPYLARRPDDPASSVHVQRALRLTGKWESGTMKPIGDEAAVRAAATSNRGAILGAVEEYHPDACILGNIDFLGVDLLHGMLEAGVPVLHSIGAPTPGYALEAAPRSSKYHLLPASEWVGRQIREARYPVDSMTVVHPGARTADFGRPFAPWPHGLRIAYAGLMLPFKGPQVLLQALAILRREGLDFKCDMAGDSTSPEFVQALREFIRSNDLSDQVRVLGFLGRNGLARLFDRSNVFVFPSLVQEAFGISQVEAMAAGLTIVTTATGGAREVVDADTALIVAPGDPVGLAEKLRALHEDPALCERMGDAARLRASRFTVTAAVDKIEQAAAGLFESH